MSKNLCLNNYYNFKNPIRHFVNINNVNFPENIENIGLKELSWTEPLKFRIRKNENDFRTLKMPNFLNFAALFFKIKDQTNFYDISSIDLHKRMHPNLITGDFKSNSYSMNLEKDFDCLCIYDNLIKIDIKSYYGRLYLHDLNLDGIEQFVGNLNNGRSNEVILGNYISLYIVETFSKQISDELENRFDLEKIDCKFSYFSDDFYFFCNNYDNSKILKIFSEVLERYELEINSEKTEFWTYEEYSDINLVEKYWKTIVAEDRNKVKNTDEDSPLLFGFINQLIYRKSKLKDEKLKRIFINNFFKSTYFNTLNWERYELQDFSCHQLFSLFKFSPEVMLYSINNFKRFDNFRNKIKEFLKVRYLYALKNNFFEEQLYYFYSIKSLDLDELLILYKNNVLNTNNQVLQSYYLYYNYFDEEDIAVLLKSYSEGNWFVNYHCLLKEMKKRNIEDNEILLYLIPEYACKDIQKQTYLNFYRDNLNTGVWFINSIEKIKESIDLYISEKIAERKEEFAQELYETQDTDEYGDIFELDYNG